MEWFREWKQRRILRRRLQDIRKGMWTCAQHPGQLPEVCRRLGIPASTMREWLIALREEAGPRRRGRLQIREMPTSAPLKPTGEKSHGSPWKWVVERGPDHLAENVRRMIMLLLDLPVAERSSGLISDLIVQLADAVAVRNGELVKALGVAVLKDQEEWLMGGIASRDVGRTSTDTSAVPARLAKIVLHDHVEEQTGESEFIPEFEPTAAMRWSKAEILQAESPVSEEEEAAAVEQDLPLPSGEWQAVAALLETVCGDAELQEDLGDELAYIDSLKSSARSENGEPQAAADLAVVIRSQLHRRADALAERSRLTRKLVEKALDTIARRVAVPFHDIRWLLEQGRLLESRSRGGPRFPEGTDVAWTLLGRMALARVPYTLQGKGPKIEWIEQAGAKQRVLNLFPYDDFSKPYRQRPQPLFDLLCREISWCTHYVDVVLDKLQAKKFRAVEKTSILKSRIVTEIHQLKSEDVVVNPGLELRPQETAPRPWYTELRKLLEGDDAKANPELAVELAGTLCRNRGYLTWEACLTLANSRAKYHRYFEGKQAGEWHVMLDVTAAANGSVEIPFAVAEQPLSSRFRRRFEEKDLTGRVRILWHLVQYAASLHASLLTITTTDAQHHLDLREDELWEVLNGEDPRT